MTTPTGTSAEVLAYVRSHPGRQASAVRARFACHCGGLRLDEWSIAVAPLLTRGDVILDSERRLWPS